MQSLQFVLRVASGLVLSFGYFHAAIPEYKEN